MRFPVAPIPTLQTEYYKFDMADLISRTEQLMASGDAQTFYTADMGDCGTGLCASSTFSSDRRTTEEQVAAYAQINMSTELGGMDFGVRLGVRYEETDVESQALAPNYVGVNWVGGNEFSAVQGDGDFHSIRG